MGDERDQFSSAAMLRLSYFRCRQRKLRSSPRTAWSVSGGLAQPRGAGEIDRDELRDAALGHRDPEQPVDARHRDAVMGHHQKAGAGGLGDLADEAAEAV